MKVVYVAGPFRGPTGWDIEQNVRRAEEIALHLWLRGYAVICPHTNTRFFHGMAEDSAFLKGTLEIMRRCDAVFTVRGWENSEGSRLEVAEARKLGIPVFNNMREMKGFSP